MSVTSQQISELRKRTGAGMMDCKRALEKANGNMDDAATELRKSGAAKADKKSDRIAAEGIIEIYASDDKRKVSVLEVNCETDFVARDENFKSFAQAAAIRALQTMAQSPEELSKAPLMQDRPETIAQSREALVGKIGENVLLRRLATLTAKEGTFATYLHGNRIGVVVEVAGGTPEVAKDVALHIAASSPKVIDASEVSQDLINQEKEIFTAQALASGKPQNIVEKMIEGRIKKFTEEVSLTGQPFVKDPSISVGELLKKNNAKVVQFTRFAVGEGVEKKVDNFVEEVMAQASAAR